MRISRTLTLFICLAMLVSQSAWAHSPRVRVGFVFGPMWGPFWYPQPWPHYPPPVVVAPPPPPVYVEQAQPAETAEPVWYYCRSAGGYYPAIRSCVERWLPVLPEPEK